MHGGQKRGNALNLLVFVIFMGPLIWLSQTLHWGDTGTFVCVVIGLVGGFIALTSSKSVSKQLGRTFNRGNKQAAADFMFSPSVPGQHQQELLQYRKQALSRVGTWNVPQTPMMPHPQKTPMYDATRNNRNRVQITQVPDPTARTLQAPRYSPDAGMQQQAARRAQAGGPPLQLGPGAEMYLTASLTGAIVVDVQTRRMAAPVFVEEWMRLGLGLLIIDVYGEYINYLAPLLSEGFGFLAGSEDWQGSLTKRQHSRYMRLEGTQDAAIVGEGIATEGLQVVFNVPSYQNTVNMGTYLLALLTGVEHKSREIPSKPCAILVTDARPLLPTHDEDCLIANEGVAQNIFDMLMNMLENAGFPGLRNLAVFLVSPTLEEIEDEVLAACRLWVVNSTTDKIISDVSEYIDLSQEEVEQLQDGDVLLLNAPQAESSFVRFRKTQFQIGNRPLLPSQEHKTEELETEQEDDNDPLGENLGLKEQQA